MAAEAAPTGWWMYHGDPAHTGRAGPIESTITAAALRARQFGVVATLRLGGPVLAVPAVSDGFIYVGLASAPGLAPARRGMLHKVALATGKIAATFTWPIEPNGRDTHGFRGMGTTPAVVGGRVYFVDFDARLHCLDASTLTAIWTTDLRNRDMAHNQPVQSFDPTGDTPPAAGWSSPLVVNGRVYVGIGACENPTLYSFVFCVDAGTGNVIWIFCTNQFATGYQNKPNELPASVLKGLASPPSPFTVRNGAPVTLGCSVRGSIAYDANLDRLYCPVGNGVPGGPSATQGWSNGLLTLNATTGAFVAFFQIPAESNHRESDIDADVGASPVLYTLPSGQRVVAVGARNGSFFVLDADTLACVAWRRLLPTFTGTSDAENQSGIYSTAAVDPIRGRLFVGVGGNNHRAVAPGIDTETTPFLRALDWITLADAWATVDYPYMGRNVRRYAVGTPPLYSNANESGPGSPAIANDVVFMATSFVSLYAFSAADGTLLFEDRLGHETGGFDGGYGTCMGPAICGDYVVAGALVFGGDGGVLRIYGLTPAGE